MWRKALAQPILRVVLVLGLFHLPWPGLGPQFARYFGHVAPHLLSLWSSPTLLLELTPAGAQGTEWSILFDARDAATQKQARAVLDIRRVAWVPLAVFTALAVSFPIKRPRRRLLVVALGLIALHAVSVLPLLAFFGGPEARFFLLGPTTHTAAVIAQRALLAPPGMAYALPALIWFALSWKLEPELM